MTLCVAACGGTSGNPALHPTAADNGSSAVTSGVTGATDGNTTPGNPASPRSIAPLTLSGTISNLPYDKDAVTLDVNNLQVGVVNPNALFPNGAFSLLSTTAIQASDCTSVAGVRSCKFTINNVDTSAFAGGLLLVSTDSRVPSPMGDTTSWQTLATVVTPTALTAAQASGTLGGVTAYNLSPSGLSTFASLAGTAAKTITTTGAVIGLVTDSNQAAPVAGATVTTSAAAGSIYYANADMTAGSTTGPTSANGLFLAVPASKTASVFDASASVTLPAGSTDKWAAPTAPVASPLWLVVNLAAQPN